MYLLNWGPLSVKQLVTAIARVNGHYHKLLCAMCFLNWGPLPLSVKQLVTAIGHYHKLSCGMCFHELKVSHTPQGLHYDSCYWCKYLGGRPGRFCNVWRCQVNKVTVRAPTPPMHLNYQGLPLPYLHTASKQILRGHSFIPRPPLFSPLFLFHVLYSTQTKEQNRGRHGNKAICDWWRIQKCKSHDAQY